MDYFVRKHSVQICIAGLVFKAVGVRLIQGQVRLLGSDFLRFLFAGLAESTAPMNLSQIPKPAKATILGRHSQIFSRSIAAPILCSSLLNSFSYIWVQQATIETEARFFPLLRVAHRGLSTQAKIMNSPTLGLEIDLPNLGKDPEIVSRYLGRLPFLSGLDLDQNKGSKFRIYSLYCCITYLRHTMRAKIDSMGERNGGPFETMIHQDCKLTPKYLYLTSGR